MKIGLIGINKLNQEDHFRIIHQSLAKNLHGAFSHSDEILPICSHFKVKLFQSTNELFNIVEAVYFASSLKPNFDFAINALKNSCHLFLEDISELSYDEIKQLYKVAFEASASIQLKLTKSFSHEYVQASDYIESPKLIEVSSCHTKRLRNDDYFSEVLNNLYIAKNKIQSGIKKISLLTIPVSNNHFSLVHIRVDFDNAAVLNMKFNNISDEDENIFSFYNKENVVDINFSKHFTVLNKIEDGQVIREELSISKQTAFDLEITNFINSCKKVEDQNISDSPEELKIINAAHKILEQINQSSQPN